VRSERPMRGMDIRPEEPLLLFVFVDTLSASSPGSKDRTQLLFLYILFVIPFYLQSVLVHSENCVKTCIQWHVEESSVALLCN
jgi:hypothetical protein